MKMAQRRIKLIGLDIDTEIEEAEEDPMETSDDESADDEIYKMSPVPPSENSSATMLRALRVS
jgi:hypothetical protein